MEPILLFLPMIVLFGIVTSYTDIKMGIIRNRHIILALVYIPIAYSVILLFNYFMGIPIRLSYLQDLGINMIISAMFAFAAWHFKIWSAADGKLFLAYSGLVPLTAYSNTYFSYFPSFVLLINTFFPVFIFFAGKSVLSSSRKEKLDFLRRLKRNDIIELVLSVFWITWVTRLLSFIVKFNIGLSANLLIVLLLVLILRKNLNWKLSLTISVLRIVFDFQYIFTLTFAWMFFVLTVVALSTFFILAFCSGLFIKNIKIKSLKPGMVLSDHIIHERGKYKKMDESEALGNNNILKGDLLKIGKDGGGLTEKEINKLNSLEKIGKLDFSDIRVLQTLPFSPFLFMGVILTILASGNFLILINLIYSMLG